MGVKLSEQGKRLLKRELDKWYSTYGGKFSKRLRNAKGCLAEKAYCSNKTVDRFMKGRSVSETSAQAICAALGLHLEDLLKSGEASICEEEGAIVFTDIVDSTRIQTKHGEKKYMEIIRALEAIENENLSKYQGKRNNFTGDGYLFIFEEVKGAVLWAIDVQRKLTDKPPVDKLQIRIGIHRGKFAQDAGNNNIVGLDVNFAQRVMSQAQGGTVLISQVVKEDIEADPLEDVELYYQGKFYLKGFDEQSEIYEVLWGGKKPTPIGEWPIICKNRLHEYQRLTTNPLTKSNINFQDVYTPLALVVRKKKSEPTKQEFPPQERGFSPQGNAKQSEEATLQQIAEDDFLEALRSGNGLVSQGFRIAIVGEPGSGKTTRLQRLAKWIFDEALGLPIWVPLAELKNGSLSNYLDRWERWLRNSRKSLPDLREQIDLGRVWLLLDGLDEWTQGVSENIRQKLELSEFFAKARVIITCRSNVWDAGGVNALSEFDVFRNQDFEPQQVKEYVGKWFRAAGKPDAGERLLNKLEEPGHERLWDLIRNPLRLSLLCATWYGADRAEGELPRTKAGLYQQFVKQIYEWKNFVGKSQTSSQERKEINRALARLAWEGMLAEETSGTSRFRLKEGMVSECLGDYFEKVLALGWINYIGEEKLEDNTTQKVYAFYHATFQEYFAALYIPEWQDENKTIPGWDYFMPCDHRGHPVPGKTYRIFDSRWQEVILFWLGRNDVSVETKKAFLGVSSATGLQRIIGIKDLRDSGDSCGGFYAWRARFLQVQATAEVAHHKDKELKDWVGERVSRLVEWAFARDFDFRDFDFDEDMVYFSDGMPGVWRDRYHHDPVTKIARDSLAQADRTTTISALANLLHDCDNDLKLLILKSLRKIGKGNELVIKTLTRLLEQREHLYPPKDQPPIAYTLGIIDPGNQLAIQCLEKLLDTPGIDTDTLADIAFYLADIAFYLDKIAPGNEAESLGRIDQGNPQAIHALTKLLAKPEIDNRTRRRVASSLGRIDQGNPQAIHALTELLAKPNLDDDTRRQAAESLGRIGEGNPQAIHALTELLAKPNLDDDTRSAAAESLGRIGEGNPQAIHALTELLAKPEIDNHTRRVAAESLGKIGQGKPQAIQALEELLNYPGSGTRGHTASTLHKIIEDATPDLLVSVVSRLIGRREDQYIYNILWQCA